MVTFFQKHVEITGQKKRPETQKKMQLQPLCIDFQLFTKHTNNTALLSNNL